MTAAGGKKRRVMAVAAAAVHVSKLLEASSCISITLPRALNSKTEHQHRAHFAAAALMVIGLLRPTAGAPNSKQPAASCSSNSSTAIASWRPGNTAAAAQTPSDSPSSDGALVRLVRLLGHASLDAEH